MREGRVSVTGGEVWYKIEGGTDGIPLLTLHGGPGSPHDSLEKLTPLKDDRPVVYYDQLGAGQSDRPDDLALWTVDRYVQEVQQLRDALGLTEIHLLGHSWGTMLAAAYLLTKPSGIKSVIFSSPCLSAPMWAQDQERHILELPLEVQDIISRCEADGTTDSEAYQKAVEEFNKRYVCRIDRDKSDEKKTNLAIYNYMWGPSEFSAQGTLKDFDVTGKLGELEMPALFLCGRYDEATPDTTAYYQSLVKNSRFHVFENSAHLAMVEETDEYVRVVREFLREVEAQNDSQNG